MKFKTRVFDLFRNIFRITHFDSVLRNFTQGKNYYSFIGKLVPNIYQYPPGTFRKSKLNEINFTTDLHDYHGHYIYYGFRDNSQSALFALCKPGDTIIDIGSNVGFSLLNMAKITGADGWVIGFEPDAVNFAQLEKNISINNFHNIKVCRKGLGNRPGKFRLENLVEFNSGGKRINTSGNITSADFTEVEIVTLDNFIESDIVVSKIDLIKIDVEGFELNVLKGAIKAINKYSPVLFVEVDDNNLREQQSAARELIHFLNVNGYSTLNSENNLPVKVEDDFSNCHFDVICRKK